MVTATPGTTIANSAKASAPISIPDTPAIASTVSNSNLVLFAVIEADGAGHASGQN